MALMALPMLVQQADSVSDGQYNRVERASTGEALLFRLHFPGHGDQATRNLTGRRIAARCSVEIPMRIACQQKPSSISHPRQSNCRSFHVTYHRELANIVGT